MLTAYIDESVESPHGYTVMAGFLGDESQWTVFAEKWEKALLPKRHLHMNKLRGWKSDQHKQMLEKLAAVPYECGLQSLYSSVNVSEYENKIPAFKTKAFAKGYFVTLVGLAAAVLDAIPKNERVEFVFEEQKEFAAVREHALGLMAKSPTLQRKQGNSALAKWSSVPKSSLLEPSDYLAYADVVPVFRTVFAFSLVEVLAFVFRLPWILAGG